MATIRTIDNLIINNIENQAVYDYMVANNLINENELYLVNGEGENTSVLYTPQELTEEQKAQVRANIGAISAAEVTFEVATTSKDGLMSASDKTKLDGIAAGATANTGTITKVQVNGTDVASSGTANIPAASTSAYGVTKLSSSTSSTSTALAATASAVKAAYDLADSKAPAYTYGPTDLTAGSSALATGKLYFKYK